MKAIFFDVDFTLIHPGPRFAAEGYRSFGERHGLSVDTERFDAAVMAASQELEVDGDALVSEMWMAAMGQPLTHHLRAELTRVD